MTYSPTENFLQSPCRNLWIETHGLEVYVRKSKRYINGRQVQAFDIANVTATKPSEGLFTNYLSHLTELLTAYYPEYEYIYVENVMHSRFQAFFLKHKFTSIYNKQQSMPTSFYKKLKEEKNGKQ